MQLAADFPGIRRVYLESYLRYAFTRNGVPYVISIECGNGTRKPSCREADKVALRVLRALQIVGGTPQPTTATLEPHTIDRPEAVSAVFTYHPPGDIVPGTGLRGNSGRGDARFIRASVSRSLTLPPSPIHSRSTTSAPAI